jgi:cytochrome c oxidase assembly protein subunit 15
MNPHAYQPAVHRLAATTACVALLPIVVGAIVTSLGAGMAFLDWPTSGGRNMLLYPWLSDMAVGRTDKVAEHGHRLAGIAIGLCSIALAGLLWRLETRGWVRMTGLLVLLSVIAQGVLGGMRVLANNPLMAMFHGSFAAVVFTLMAALALFTSRTWIESPRKYQDADAGWLKPLAVAAPLVLSIQYLLGGTLRHLGMNLNEHIAMGVLTFVVVVAAAVGAFLSGNRWLRRFSWRLSALVVLQVALGVGAFATKFGFTSTGYVAVQRSVEQIVLRSSHTVVGILLFMTSVLYALCVFRLASGDTAGATPNAGSLSVDEGLLL